jgi:hypothetical protein
MEQPSLFDDEQAPPIELLLPTHDLAELHRMIELVNGEPRILDTRLGAWLGYDRADNIRRLVNSHLVELGGLGILRSSYANSGRRGRPAIAFLLNRAQVNHLIAYCGLPNLSELRVLVTKVFTEWQAGNLVSTNAVTTIALQDAVAAAEEQMPGSATLGAEMARLDERLDKEHDYNAEQFTEIRALAQEAVNLGQHAVKIAQARPMTYPQTPDEAERISRRKHPYRTASGRVGLVDPRDPKARPRRPIVFEE